MKMCTPTAVCTSCVATIMVLAVLSYPVHSIVVHPAVLRNFVGPYRVRVGQPIPRNTVPFDPISNYDPEEYIRDEGIPFEQDLSPRQAALLTRKHEENVSEDLMGKCQNNEACRKNLDSTLNLLMKMMETGR